MWKPVDPHRFVGLPLITKARAEDDYIVYADGMVAGRIMLQARSSGLPTWLWSATGPALVQVPLASSGEANTLHSARLEFRQAFDDWLSWALTFKGTVHWLE